MGKLNGHRPEWAKVSLVFDILSVITIGKPNIRGDCPVFERAHNFSIIEYLQWNWFLCVTTSNDMRSCRANFSEQRISYDKCWMVTYPYAYEIAVYYRRIVLVLKFLLCSILDYIRAVTCTFCLFNVENNLFKTSEKRLLRVKTNGIK